MKKSSISSVTTLSNGSSEDSWDEGSDLEFGSNLNLHLSNDDDENEYDETFLHHSIHSKTMMMNSLERGGLNTNGILQNGMQRKRYGNDRSSNTFIYNTKNPLGSQRVGKYSPEDNKFSAGNNTKMYTDITKLPLSDRKLSFVGTKVRRPNSLNLNHNSYPATEAQTHTEADSVQTVVIPRIVVTPTEKYEPITINETDIEFQKKIENMRKLEQKFSNKSIVPGYATPSLLPELVLKNESKSDLFLVNSTSNENAAEEVRSPMPVIVKSIEANETKFRDKGLLKLPNIDNGPLQ